MAVRSVTPAMRVVAPGARVNAGAGRRAASDRVAPRAARSTPVVASTTQLKTREGAELRDGIAKFYNASTPVWDNFWGEHLHHGYYPGGKPRKDHQQAQVDMVDNALAWAGVDAVRSVVDVGCGIGGSTRHIARKYGATGVGVTLSSVQVAIANQRTAAAGLSGVTFQVADALNMPFADNSFDLVWSMESGEHMPDKRLFMSEMVRVAQPGGRILLVTWCVRALAPGEADYSDDDKALLTNICKAYYLPQWCSIDRYRELAEEMKLEGIKTDDWSLEVQPFWRAVIDTALTPQGFFGLLKSGFTTIQGALVMPLMQEGLRRGLIKFNLMTCTKPL